MNLVYSDRPTQTASLTIQSLDTDAAVIAMVKAGTEKGVLCDVSSERTETFRNTPYRFVPEYRLLQRNPHIFVTGTTSTCSIPPSKADCAC